MPSRHLDHRLTTRDRAPVEVVPYGNHSLALA